jgi:hypothetical protein
LAVVDEPVLVVEVVLLAAPAVAIALPAAPIATHATATVTSFTCLRRYVITEPPVFTGVRFTLADGCKAAVR